MSVADTTFLVDVLGNESAAKAKLADLVARQQPLWLPAPALHELYFGAGLYARPERERGRVDELAQALPWLPFDGTAAKLAGTLEAQALRQGRRPDRADIQIAAIALARGDSVLTRDRRFPAPQGLSVERY